MPISARKGPTTPKAARKASPNSGRRSASPGKAKGKKAKGKKKIVTEGTTSPDEIETEFIETELESSDVTPAASWRCEDKPEPYSLRRCKNCTFYHFALCGNCPRCQEPQPIWPGTPVETVKSKTFAVLQEVKAGFLDFASNARDFAVNAARTAEEQLASLVNSKGPSPPARLFEELDVTKDGQLTIDNLVIKSIEYFRTQLTVYPDHWIRIQITKRDEDGDGMLNQIEFERAFDILIRS